MFSNTISYVSLMILNQKGRARASRSAAEVAENAAERDALALP